MTKPNDLLIPVVVVQVHLDHATKGWTLRAVEHDGKSVRCSVYRFGRNDLTEEQARKLQGQALERRTIDLKYWKRESYSPYSSDWGL